MTTQDRETYLRLLHAMQAGVAKEQEIDPKSTTAKHLRVGINATRSDQGALVELLIEKGVFTSDEYDAKVVKYMAREKKAYEDLLLERTGIPYILEGRT